MFSPLLKIPTCWERRWTKCEFRDIDNSFKARNITNIYVRKPSGSTLMKWPILFIIYHVRDSFCQISETMKNPLTMEKPLPQLIADLGDRTALSYEHPQQPS
jgi:hypothetical protein